MAAGPSGLEKKVPPGVFLTPLDEFVCCYRAGPECLINILEFLDFDDEGNNRNLHIPEEETKGNPLFKQVWPTAGFCIKTLNGGGGLVFINLCHCEDIECPSNALLDTLLNMTTDQLQTVDLPVSLGKPHRERDEDGDVCLAFDVILNTDFYEKQVVRYELLKAYVLVMVMRGLNEKYHLDLQMTIVAQVTEQAYWGKMPQHFIDRKKSAFYEDQEFARVFYAARARRTLRWAKKFAVKRLKKQPGRSSNCFRIRPVHPPRSRTTACRECIRRNLVNPEEVIEEDSEDAECSEEEVEEGSEEGSEEEGGSEEDGSEEESSDEYDDSGEEENREVEKSSDVQEDSEEDEGSEEEGEFEEEEGSEREEDFEEEEGSAEQGFEEETGSEEEDSSEEDEGSEEEGFEDGCYEEAEGSGEDIEVDSQEKVDENFEEERSSVEEDSGEEGDVEEGSDEEKYSEEEDDSEENETSEEEEDVEEEDPEEEEDSEERMNLEKEIERDLKEEVENVLMKGVGKVLIQKELKDEVEKEIREEVEKYLREEVKKYFEKEVVKHSSPEVVQDPYIKEKEDYGMKIVDPTEAAVPLYGSISEPLSPTPGLEASVSMQADLPITRDVKPPPLKVEYVDFNNGIYKLGFILEDEHTSSPSVVSPGDWKESVLLLNSIVPKENSLNLDYEIFEMLQDEQLQYVAVLDLPPGTKVEGMGVFASADGVVLCNENGMRFCEMPLEYEIIPTRIKVMVDCLKVMMAIPFTEEAMKYRMADEEAPDIVDYYLHIASRSR